MEIQCKLVERIGTRLTLRIYWGEDCPNCYGSGSKGCHNAEIRLKDVNEIVTEWIDPDQYANEIWPTKCDHCDALVPENLKAVGGNRQIGRNHLYNTESGNLEPGCMWFESHHHKEQDGRKFLCRWDNCNDPRGHLYVMLPDGRTWDTDSRASNCTRKDDRTHRCWVKHGEAPNLHIDKNGDTCQAGAGSIWTKGYHGFLHHGKLVDC